MQPLSLKKSFLYALIGSVGLSALLGILAIAIGDFGEFEVRVLLTSLTISGASLCGLSCGAALETGRARVLPLSGIALAALAALLVVAGIWSEFRSDLYWKSTATVSILAVACSHMALLLLARLAPQYAWAKWTAGLAVFSVVMILSAMLWGDVDEDPMFRLLGVAAILDGAITILIPILHRLSRADVAFLSGPGGASLLELDREINRLRSRLAELEQARQQMAPAEPTQYAEIQRRNVPSSSRDSTARVSARYGG
jgi:hypothetical protein